MMGYVALLVGLCPYCLLPHPTPDVVETEAEFWEAYGQFVLDPGDSHPAFDILWAESRGRLRAENPRSSARGLFQKMTSKHGEVEGCGVLQTAWADGYAKARYGGWIEALRFRRENGWW